MGNIRSLKTKFSLSAEQQTKTIECKFSNEDSIESDAQIFGTKFKLKHNFFKKKKKKLINFTLNILKIEVEYDVLSINLEKEKKINDLTERLNAKDLENQQLIKEKQKMIKEKAEIENQRKMKEEENKKLIQEKKEYELAQNQKEYELNHYMKEIKKNEIKTKENGKSHQVKTRCTQIKTTIAAK